MLGLATGAARQQPVKIGVIYPLSGNSASAGNYSKMAIEVGADVINNGNADLAKIMPLAKGGGLPGLGGAKIQLIFADNQGTPAAGQNQALRLISEEKVAALIGAYQSGITLTASAIAERHGIPFLTAESVAANLTERGFKWFFRTTPVAIDFARAYSTFLKEQKAAGQKVGSIALVHENTEYGNSVASVIADQFAKDGLPITQKIAYSANSSDVQPQVLQLKEKNPDVVIFISYTSDAILYAKTMKELNWKPAIMIADNAGFNDPAFVKSHGLHGRGPGQPLGLLRRQAGQRAVPLQRALQEEVRRRRARRRVGARPAGLPGDGRRHQPRRLDRSGQDPGARSRPPTCRPSQMAAGYDGVKFDDKGQNVLASSVVTQLRAASTSRSSPRRAPPPSRPALQGLVSEPRSRKASGSSACRSRWSR